MEFINLTKLLIVLTFCLVLIWDITVMIFSNNVNATISIVLYTLSKNHPMIPFIIGVLCGHVFWPLKG
jgi:hypothetical protein